MILAFHPQTCLSSLNNSDSQRGVEGPVSQVCAFRTITRKRTSYKQNVVEEKSFLTPYLMDAQLNKSVS